MAIRFKSEFTSDQGDTYKIEIHDTDWLGGVYDFRVDSRGFELEYTGETDDIVSPIIGSKLTIGAYSNDGYFETFITSLKDYQEDRFRIVVYRSETHERRAVEDGLVFEPLLDEGTETIYNIWWCGWLMQDLISVEDASQPYVYELTAVDGLGRLANIDYTDSNVITQNGFGLTRVNEIIKNTLVNTELDDLFGTSDVFFETCVNWWETTAHTYSTSTDPLYLTAADVGLFDSRDDDGNLVRTSSFDVLRQIATLFNARVYMERGRFVFEQIGTRTNVTRYITTYTKTATKISTTATSDDIVLDQTLYGARLAGNQWNFLPALKRVSVNYTQRFLSPWFGAYRFENGDTEFTPGFIAGGQGIQLALYGPINYAISCSNRLEFGNDTNQLVVIFRVEIRVEDSSNPGTYWYFNRPFNTYATAVTFGTAGWSTTAGYYYFDMPMTSVYESIGSTYLLNTITTTDLPVTGTLRVRFDLYNKYDLANSGAAYVLDTGIGQSETWNAVVAFSRVDDGSEPANGEVYTSTNGSANVGSNLTLELGDVIIADGALQTGDLTAYNGSSWVATGSWRVGNSGTGLPILKLLTAETLALHYKPVQRYDGNVVVSSHFGRRIVFGSTYYLRLNGRYVANTDEWSGTYFAVQRDRTNVTTADPVPLDRTPAGKASGTTGANNTPNELTAGKVGGMTLDATNQKIGPFQEVTGGGKVNGFIQLDTSFVPNGEQPGAIFWNDDTGTSAVVLADGEFLDAGEKSVWHVKNQTGSTIAKGTAVAANGTLGASGRILITPMKGDGTIAAKYFLGLANADILSGEDGYVVSKGKIRQVDTSAFTEGSVLWVHPTNAGELTDTEPTAPNLKLPVAFVVYADANGTLAIRQTAGSYLSESHDVKIDSPVSGELLARTGSNVWENVELGSLFNAGTDAPGTEAGESFAQVYGTNTGTMLGEPTKWFRITIGGTDYVIPLYLPA